MNVGFEWNDVGLIKRQEVQWPHTLSKAPRTPRWRSVLSLSGPSLPLTPKAIILSQPGGSAGSLCPQPLPPIKRNCSESVIPTWICKTDQQPEEQESGQKAKEPATSPASPELKTDTPAQTPTMGLGAPPPPTTPAAAESQRDPTSPRVCPTRKTPSTLDSLMV